MIRKTSPGAVALAVIFLTAWVPSAVVYAAARPRASVVVGWSANTCAVTWNGAPIENGDLQRRAQALRRPRKVTLTILADAPYRCIGSAIYQLQRARAKMTVVPPWPSKAVQVTVGSRPCRPTIDGVGYSLDEFGERAKGLRDEEVRFMPSPDADYACVDAVLAKIKEAGIHRLGFIGNEYVGPERRK